MLIKCPECEQQISDKAIICPHCGYPLQSMPKNIKQKKSNKRCRLPNGFGQISELKGQNLRKPFRVMITIGKTDEGRPICRLLKPEAYFKTYNDAYLALMEYNRNPYDFMANITMEELFERWFPVYCKDVEEASAKNIKGSWQYCSMLKKMPVNQVRVRHMKQCLEEGTAIIGNNKRTTTPSVRKNMKIIFSKMLDYAVEYEIVDHNYAKDFTLSKTDQKILDTTQNPHIPYTPEELEIIWENINNYWIAEVVLLQCYSGWRPQELSLLELKNINLEKETMTGGLKTDSGKNRTVPIHSKIYPIVERLYSKAVEKGSKYLINFPGSRKSNTTDFTYMRYKEPLTKMVHELGLNPDHRPHDGRKTFVTLAKEYQLDEYAIKYMVGHKISDITESIYTQRKPEWFKSEIEKIK